MPYLISTFDRPGTGELRAEIRPAHLRYLDSTKHLLIACGAKLDEDGVATGSLYLVDVETRAEAEEYIAGDPFAQADMFREVQIERWRKAFVDGKSFVDLG